MRSAENRLRLAFVFVVTLNGILCFPDATILSNANSTDVDVGPPMPKSITEKDNVTLVSDSELSASERTRRLLPYMAFYVPVQDLSINQDFSPIPTANQAVRPSGSGDFGPLLNIPQQYVHAKDSANSGQSAGPVSSLYLPPTSNAGSMQYEPTAGDVYHRLTYGGPQNQHFNQHSQSQQLPPALKQIDNYANQKYIGHQLQHTHGSTGPSAPFNVNLPGRKIKPVRHKTVQHFPPLPSQSDLTTSPFGGTSPTKQTDVDPSYHPRDKQAKINLTPFTPSNSVPGNFVPIVYTPPNGNNNNIVLTSQATASSHDESVTPLNEGTKQQHIAIEYSTSFSPSGPQSIHGIDPYHYSQQNTHSQSTFAFPPKSSQDSEQANVAHATQHHHSQYFSVTPANIASPDVEVRHQYKQVSSPPYIYDSQNQHQHLDQKVINASRRPSQQLTSIKSKQQDVTTQQRYRTKIAPIYQTKPQKIFSAELQQASPQQFHYIDQQHSGYSARQPQTRLEQNQEYASKPKYKERIKQETHNHQPTHIFVLSSTVAPHDITATALTPIRNHHSSSHYTPTYPQHSPKHHGLSQSPSSSPQSQSQIPFGEQILTIPVRTLFADFRSKHHSHYSPSSVSPSSSSHLSLASEKFAYHKHNGPHPDQYAHSPVEEPKQSLDDEQNSSGLRPTLGPPTHAYIIVTTASPHERQPISYENYGSTVSPSYKNKINERVQPVAKDRNPNYPGIQQPQSSQEPIVSITPMPNVMSTHSSPKYVYVKEEFGQKLPTLVIKPKPLRKIENNKQIPAKQRIENTESDETTLQALTPRPDIPKTQTIHNLTEVPPLGSLSDPNELPDIRTSSLAEILHKLQESNHLPHTLTPDNIDNSIKTLIRILNNLKQTQTIVANPPQHHETSNAQSADYDYTTSKEEQENEKNPLQTELNSLSPSMEINKYPGPSTGRPGTDYPNYAEIPPTSFDCRQQRYKGFFGDPETRCQVWHYCDLNGGKASFLCPNGTIFSQIALTCDWWFNVKCATTAQLYVLNERLYKYILPFTPKFPEDYSGPLVDKYLAMKFQEMEEKMRLEKEKAEREAEMVSEGDDEAENETVDTTTEISPLSSSIPTPEKKSESIKAQVSEQSSERNLLIDDEVDDISQRESSHSFESTTKVPMTATIKPQEIALSLKPIVVSSTMEPDYDEIEQVNLLKRHEDEHILTSNKTELKEHDTKITVEKIEVIEIKPDGATGHIIREMIRNSKAE